MHIVKFGLFLNYVINKLNFFYMKTNFLKIPGNYNAILHIFYHLGILLFLQNYKMNLKKIYIFTVT